MPKGKKYFDEVDTKISFPKMEEDLLENWYSSGLVDKYLHKNDSSEKKFSFLDGPITANAPMGVHHGWGRTYKDLWQRYKNMKGYKQRFQNGFDAQGLWVEVEVEKDLGFKSKKDIEKYGVAKFVKKCKARVNKYSKIQTDQSKRLGYFMDWDNSYFTMSDENNYMIWHFLKVCHENGWLYKGAESVPWCPRCETAISQHEMLTEDYKEVVHKAITFSLPIKEKEHKDEYLLVWTTTPWTLPANIAVAVDKNMDYALVKDDSEKKYWVAKEAVERIFGKRNKKVLKTQKGKGLVGLTYDGPFDHLPAVAKIKKEHKNKFHKVIATMDRIMPISAKEGTGLVHTAVSAGTEDFKLGKELGLPMIPVIADDASYLDGFEEFSGKNAKVDPNLIFGYLQEKDKKGGNWVFDIQKYKHRYPGCWRCKTELVWKVTDEWYIAMDRPSRKASDSKSSQKTLREKMIEVAQKIDWIPDFGLKRELDWLNNMHDWLISKKNRYWGLCLPIWECNSCGEFIVIGGKEELKKKAVEGWEEFEGNSPHKPYIDKVKVKCEKCGKLAERIEPVGNPWLDAGIVSFSTIKENNQGEPLYKIDKEKWQEWFPANFITESFPGQFKNWFYSLIAMSSVLENTNPTQKVLGYATCLAEDGRAMHKSWGNSIEFNEGAERIGVDVMRWMYAKQKYSDNLLFGYNIANEVRRTFHLKLWNIYNFFVTYANIDKWQPDTKTSFDSENLLDKWLMSRLADTVSKTDKYLSDFKAYKATKVLEDFVYDFSNWYIRRSRDRVGPTAKNNKDKNAFYQTTYLALTTLMQVLAPFVPFMTEKIYTNLTKKESVHLSDWPTVSYKIEKKIEEKMQNVRELSEVIHAKRKEKGVPVRQPLASFSAKAPFPMPEREYLAILLAETNIKNAYFKKDKSEDLEVTLDLKLTPKLEEAAKTRELIRKIQKERKKMKVSLTQKVKVQNDWLPESKENIQKVRKGAGVKELKKGDFAVSL